MKEYRPHSYSKGKHTRVGAAFIINETVCEISGPMGALERSGIVQAASAKGALTWRYHKIKEQ